MKPTRTEKITTNKWGGKTTTTTFNSNHNPKFKTATEVFDNESLQYKRNIKIMNKQTATPKTTNVFTILNEDRMEIVKQTIRLKENIKYEMPMIFATEQEANEFASSKLEMWDVINSNFNHKFIQHNQNTKPEVVKIETGKSIDTDSVHLNVKIRFADKWDMDFVWTMNNKTNWVHTNAEPTHLDGVEIEETMDNVSNRSQQITKDAEVIMEYFNFDDDMIGVEIENREHLVS